MARECTVTRFRQFLTNRQRRYSACEDRSAERLTEFARKPPPRDAFHIWIVASQILKEEVEIILVSPKVLQQTSTSVVSQASCHHLGPHVNANAKSTEGHANGAHPPAPCGILLVF